MRHDARVQLSSLTSSSSSLFLYHGRDDTGCYDRDYQVMEYYDQYRNYSSDANANIYESESESEEYVSESLPTVQGMNELTGRDIVVEAGISCRVPTQQCYDNNGNNVCTLSVRVCPCVVNDSNGNVLNYRVSRPFGSTQRHFHCFGDAPSSGPGPGCDHISCSQMLLDSNGHQLNFDAIS